MHNLRPIFTHFRLLKKHPLTKSGKLACFSLIVLNLTACSTMTTKRSTTTAIMEERANVLTGSRLSNDTQSRLIQAGLEEGECLANMPNCIVQLKQAELNQQPDKGLYGAVAELFLHRQDNAHKPPIANLPSENLPPTLANVINPSNLNNRKPSDLSLKKLTTALTVRWQNKMICYKRCGFPICI